MSETLALLQTDVVNSTELSERLGDSAMSSLWEAHDRIARDLLRDWHGQEIDKSDGFLLVFRTAAEAVHYAIAYHRAIATLPVPLRARAGLHVGAVIRRETPGEHVAMGAKPIEVDGVAKPTAARVMGLALGGQTLLSAQARAALGATHLRVESRGHWRAKGLEEPIELFEIGDETAPFETPPDSAKMYRVMRRGDLWLPVRELRHSLPAERDPFVGRQESLRELARRFDDGARLVSLLGMGGTGKTRLAQRFGWAWLGDYPGGVWFCDLSQARSLDGIVHAVAQGIDVPLGSADPVTQIGNALAGRGSCLVILDNFEQLVRHAEETVGHWLDRAGEARFIVTTRQVLGIAGEEAYALAPLPTSEGCALFARRAAAAASNFRPSREDDAAIVALVRLLDGLPLAIELAAARVRLMPPRALLPRLREHFELLSSRGGRPERQATLRRTFDWSWALLSEDEKAALAQLSVFEGGFTLESAEAVLELPGAERRDAAFDALQSLVDKSFVRPVSEQRFDLLWTVKEYAAEHLRNEGRYPGSGPAAAAAAEGRHGAYFAGLDERSAIDHSCIEMENLVAACRRAAARGDADLASRALEGAWAAVRLRGPFRVGCELAALVAGSGSLALARSAHVHHVAGSAMKACGRTQEARSHFSAALADARAAGDWKCVCAAENLLGQLLTNDGRIDEARVHFDEALRLSREVDDPALRCDVLNAVGDLHIAIGALDEAQARFEQALVVARKSGHRRWEGGTVGNLGLARANQGRLAEAGRLFQSAVLIARELGDRQWEGNALCNLGWIHQTEGKFEDARAALEEALQISRDLGHPRLEAVVLCNLGIVLEALGMPEEAIERHESALTVARDLGDRRSEGQFLTYLGLLNGRQARFENARAILRSAEQLLESISDRISLGVLLCALAETEHRAGEQEAALFAFRKASALAETLGAQETSEIRLSLARVSALIATAPGASASVEV